MEFSLFLFSWLSFLTSFVTFFGCFQSLGVVTGEEFNMFMAFLRTLSIFESKAPQEIMQELVEILEGQADLDSQFDVSFSCHI